MTMDGRQGGRCGHPTKKGYIQAVACGMRAKQSYDEVVEQAKAQVDDIVNEASYLNAKSDESGEKAE